MWMNLSGKKAPVAAVWQGSGDRLVDLPWVLVDPLNGDSWVGLAKTYVRTFGKVVRGD